MNFKKTVLIGLLFSPALAYSNNEIIDNLNNKSSCDSTCTKEITVNQINITSNQEMIACPAGFKGKISKTIFVDDNIILPKDTQSNCVCEPQTYTEKLDCPANQKGEIVRERKWSCNNNSGSYTQWTEISNTCKIYSVAVGLEERSVACPAGQVGEKYENRSFVIYSDGSKNDYSNWTTKGSSCVPDPALNAGGGSGLQGFLKDYFAGASTTCSGRASDGGGTFWITMTLDGNGYPSFTIRLFTIANYNYYGYCYGFGVCTGQVRGGFSTTVDYSIRTTPNGFEGTPCSAALY